MYLERYRENLTRGVLTRMVMTRRGCGQDRVLGFWPDMDPLIELVLAQGFGSTVCWPWLPDRHTAIVWASSWYLECLDGCKAD